MEPTFHLRAVVIFAALAIKTATAAEPPSAEPEQCRYLMGDRAAALASAENPGQIRPDDIVLTVDRDGAISWGSHKLGDTDALFERLKSVVVSYPQPALLIQGDQAASFGSIRNVVRTAQRVGIVGFRLVPGPPELPPPPPMPPIEVPDLPRGLDISIPPPPPPPSVCRPPIIVGVDSDGTVYLDSTAVPDQTVLDAKLAQIGATPVDEQPMVEIRGSPLAPYKFIIPILASARRLGVIEVGLDTNRWFTRPE